MEIEIVTIIKLIFHKQNNNSIDCISSNRIYIYIFQTSVNKTILKRFDECHNICLFLVKGRISIFFSNNYWIC